MSEIGQDLAVRKKQKGLVPRLRFPEFRGAEEWEEKKLGDFLNESRISGSKGNIAKKITVKLWGNGVFEKKETVLGSSNTQYFRRKAGQFIYSKLDFLNQAFGIVPESLDNFESTVDLPCFDIAEGLNAGFILNYIKRKDFYERFGETADGSRKARRVHTETFLSFSITLPSKPEQQKIADCLSSLDDLITAESKQLEALKTHKKGLMQQLFPREGETVPRLRFPEFREAGEWEEKKLGEISDVVASGDLDPACFSQIKTNDHIYPVYSNAVYEQGFYGYYSKPKYPKGSITITARGTLGVAFVRTQEFMGIGRLLVVSDFNNVDAIFMGECWNHLGKIPTELTSIPQFTAVAAKATWLPIPLIEEQRRIADCLSSLDDLIAAQSKKIDALKTHKKGLMQQLFPVLDEAVG
ncbi:restriction endonuclease subunit S [Acidithiobacillus montserratensis]|uniref:Restriction endonuclease subunit S n=1 Tax=Acidithiobacillus montserratensis TaxID=2729135 RepID=A0ACD5HDQ5_9PROT|nr:restriction endonuclease subunit S [Acidithiobacillus montserratensis]MBU2747221.1 restriction endonuclease subunit S [Acidithiobacillus montserratensis]